MASQKISELKAMSEAELISQHDRLAHSADPSVNYYLEELARRDEGRKMDLMLDYTSQIKWLTVAVTIATLVNLVIAVVQCLR